MEEFMKWAASNVDKAIIVGEVFLVVFVTLIISLFAKHLCKKLEKRANLTTRFWDNILVHALTGPLVLFIWVLGLTFAGELVNAFSEQIVISDAVVMIRHLGILGAFAWFMIRFIHQAEEELTASKKIDKTTADAVSKLLRFSVLITVALVALQEMGISISGILAFGGVGGIVLGFAAKDLLSNFFGGFMIYLDRPFKVGDWIRSASANLEGTVEQIGWRLTRIRNFESQPVYVPNSLFTQIILENPSRMRYRRIKTVVGVRYDDFAKIELIVSDIKAMLQSRDDIAQDATMLVNFDEYAESSLNILVYTFANTREWAKFKDIQQDVLIKIGKIIEGHQAEIAFPTRTIHGIAD